MGGVLFVATHFVNAKVLHIYSITQESKYVSAKLGHFRL